MSQQEKPFNEETLDPQDWDSVAELGHRMVDEVVKYLRTIRERPAWKEMPANAKQMLRQPLPIEPENAEKAYSDFVQYVLPYPHGNIHPRYWGFVNGSGTVTGAFAEMLAATMNPNCGGTDHSAVHVELQVLEWFKEMLGYPAEASGILVSGGSVANLIALAIARNTHAGVDVRKHGVGAASRRMIIYGSSETHSSVQKAAELLGLGSEGLRKIAVDSQYRIDLEQLRRAIAEDRAAGKIPICVVGNAGTVNTGAIDPLAELAELCRTEKLWFHVDGAFGALAALLQEYRDRLAGMERADSLAFDLHKWMYMPYEAGCVMVRNAGAHRQTFALTPDYLMRQERGFTAAPLWFSDYGIQLSRGFRALKVWFSLKEHGVEKYRRLIRQNVAQAKYLAHLVESEAALELLAPVPLNIVCYRFVDKRLDAQALNALNREILNQLQMRGIAVPTQTLLKGKFAIRAAICNHRSRREDFEVLVRETVRIGRELMAV